MPEGRVRGWFMGPMRDSEIVEASHEPSLRPRPRFVLLVSEDEDEDEDENENDWVHGPNPCGKTKGGFP